MKLSEFKIGEWFFTGSGEWKCTDIGTRTVVAIKKEDLERAVLKNPPFDVCESVFDEYGQQDCSKKPH